MIAYIDSSVLLRILLRQRDPLEQWPRIDLAISSNLLRVECLRTLDRLRLAGQLSPAEARVQTDALADVLRRIDFVEVDPLVLDHAAQPLPAPLGALDAIHLASALLYRERHGDHPILFATHDVALARAARAMHFDVVGVAA